MLTDGKTATDPQVGSLQREDLIKLFVHWDVILSQKELLFTPLAFAGLGVVANSWEKRDPLIVLALAAGSIAIYVYHLFVIRRLRILQRNISRKLSATTTDFDDIVTDKLKRLGVQTLRIYVLPLLGSAWALTIYACVQPPSTAWQAVMTVCVVGTGLLAYWLILDAASV